VTRQTVTRWSRKPGAPGRLEVGPWQTFLQNGTAYGGGPSGYQAKCQHIRFQNEKLQWEIAELQRNYTATADVEKWKEILYGKIREFVSIIPKVAPEVVGCGVPETEARLKRLEDELLQRLHAIQTSIS